MGKKSLIKSTSKKKSTAKAKAAKAAKAAKNAKAKKEMPKSKEIKNSNEKTKTATKAKPESKTAVASKESKKSVLQELLFKKFDRETPQKIYTPPSDGSTKDYSAPPLISGKSKTETERLKKLLFNKYSMDAVVSAAKSSAAPAKKSNPIQKTFS
jgi:hypothetical protein